MAKKITVGKKFSISTWAFFSRISSTGVCVFFFDPQHLGENAGRSFHRIVSCRGCLFAESLRTGIHLGTRGIFRTLWRLGCFSQLRGIGVPGRRPCPWCVFTTVLNSWGEAPISKMGWMETFVKNGITKPLPETNSKFCP